MGHSETCVFITERAARRFITDVRQKLGLPARVFAVYRRGCINGYGVAIAGVVATYSIFEQVNAV